MGVAMYSGHPEYCNTEAYDPGESREVSKLIYGCMDLGGDWKKTSFSELSTNHRNERLALSVQVLECCFTHGINFFDHADIYGCGKSEEVFALAIQELQIPREQYLLQSKCGIVLPDTPDQSPYYNFDTQHIVEQVEGSLQRLASDYLDVLLLHRPDALVEPEEVAEAFTLLQQQGKVRAFGVSNQSAAQITLLQAYLPFQLCYNQMQVSLLHHELLSAGLEYNTPNPVKPYFEVVDYCRLNEIRIQAWSPVARGKLFHKPDSDKKKTLLQEALEQMAEQKNCSPGVLAIAWLLRHPAGIQPIIGTTKPERLRDYCRAVASDLEEELLSKAEWYQLLVAAREKNLP